MRPRSRNDGYPPNMRPEDILADVSCNFCGHRFQGRLGCSAFPNGNIPLEILKGDNRHLEPVPGDQGITFSPLPVLIIDSPLTPLSTQAEVAAWIAELQDLRRKHAGDYGALAQLWYEIERARQWERSAGR